MKQSKMSIRARILGTLGVATALILVGATGASAWTFATTGSPQRALYNGVSFGDGAGNIYRHGYNSIYIDVLLKDPVSNGNSAYQITRAWKPGQPGWTGASTQTARRSGSTWASMPRKTINTVTSSVGSWASSRVCEDAPLRPDICSTTRSSGL